MACLPFALYDAFCDTAFGGSQAAIISDAASLDAGIMGRIVQELGLPATGFVSLAGPRSVDACFRSTVMELPMCGHGTVALMTRMVELGRFDWKDRDAIEVELRLPRSKAAVSIARRDDGRPLVMLAVRPPCFRRDAIDRERLAALLGIPVAGLAPDLPMETACADFVHLVVPMRDLDAMRDVTPDFSGLVALCHDHGIETVALFSTEVENPGSTLHVRDFCPAVGGSRIRCRWHHECGARRVPDPPQDRGRGCRRQGRCQGRTGYRDRPGEHDHLSRPPRGRCDRAS